MGPDLVLPPGIPITGQRRGYCDAKLKRLEEGTYQLPAVDAATQQVRLSPTDLALLLGGIDLASVRRRRRYRGVAEP